MVIKCICDLFLLLYGAFLLYSKNSLFFLHQWSQSKIFSILNLQKLLLHVCIHMHWTYTYYKYVGSKQLQYVLLIFQKRDKQNIRSVIWTGGEVAPLCEFMNGAVKLFSPLAHLSNLASNNKANSTSGPSVAQVSSSQVNTLMGFWPQSFKMRAGAAVCRFLRSIQRDVWSPSRRPFSHNVILPSRSQRQLLKRSTTCPSPGSGLLHLQHRLHHSTGLLTYISHRLSSVVAEKHGCALQISLTRSTYTQTAILKCSICFLSVEIVFFHFEKRAQTNEKSQACVPFLRNLAVQSNRWQAAALQCCEIKAFGFYIARHMKKSNQNLVLLSLGGFQIKHNCLPQPQTYWSKHAEDNWKELVNPSAPWQHCDMPRDNVSKALLSVGWSYWIRLPGLWYFIEIIVYGLNVNVFYFYLKCLLVQKMI